MKSKLAPSMMLRLATLLALTLALIFRVECVPQPVSSSHTPTIAAKLIEAGKVATRAASVDALKLLSHAPIKRTPAVGVRVESFVAAHAPVAAAWLPSRVLADFPRVLAVRRRIPRLGSEEPPWQSRHV